MFSDHQLAADGGPSVESRRLLGKRGKVCKSRSPGKLRGRASKVCLCASILDRTEDQPPGRARIDHSRTGHVAVLLGAVLDLHNRVSRLEGDHRYPTEHNHLRMSETVRVGESSHGE
ncbi:hypothetical protein DIPPA_00100 [Diplonema papillatum]|nr:hypothetical protein DIPPA_00100 [Diplonema papillatum]